jgi:Cu(I)/Ag(I) efflux system membrane fusion protein/cobalt-zinc-cadmium efflux system membrane fusion protein
MNIRTLALVTVVAVLAGLAGWLASSTWEDSASGGASHVSTDGPCANGAAPRYWKAPMDPTYVRNQPGKSPMGMDLVPVCPGSDEAEAGDGIHVRSNVVQNMGVRTEVVHRHDLTRPIRAVGRVDYDERLISHVHTKIQGWIENLHVEYEGQVVRKGQPMIELYSPDLVATEEELLVAARYRDTTAKSEFPDVREGGADLFEATRRRLELWDIPDRDIERLLSKGEIRKTTTLYAPSSGVVTHIMARQGMEVGPSDNLYTIADLSRVWVYADIYPYEVAWVHQGQPATVALRQLPGRALDAKVAYVYPLLDPATRTVRVRIELPNPDRLLKPEMYATVVIQTEKRTGVLAISDEAVIRSGERNLVIVSLGEGRFEPRTVELGVASGDGWIEIRSGLREGEVVVTSGQFLLDSESNLQEAVQNLLPAPDHAPEAPRPSEADRS